MAGFVIGFSIEKLFWEVLNLKDFSERVSV